MSAGQEQECIDVLVNEGLALEGLGRYEELYVLIFSIG